MIIGDYDFRILILTLLLFQIAVTGNRPADDVRFCGGIRVLHQISKGLVEIVVKIDRIPGHA